MRPDRRCISNCQASKAIKSRDTAQAELLRRSRSYDKISAPAQDLRERASGARVLVTDLAFTDRSGLETPSFLYDTDFVGEQKAELAFRATTIERMGLGGHLLALEQLKRTLAREGLFAAERKRRL